MPRCRADVDGEYVCDRKKDHKGKHREHWYGYDTQGRFRIVVRWKRDAR